MYSHPGKSFNSSEGYSYYTFHKGNKNKVNVRKLQQKVTNPSSYLNTFIHIPMIYQAATYLFIIRRCEKLICVI